MLLAAAGMACAPEPLPLFRIGTNTWLGYEPLYLARALGFLQPAEARLVEYPSNSLSSGSFRNGATEAVCLTLDELLVAAQEGADAQIVLAMDFSAGADVILGQPSIKSMADLKGRRVGVEDGALGAYMLSRGLELAGVDPAEVVTVPLELNEHERAFGEGRVDAVVTFEPVSSRLLAKGATLLFDSGRIPGEIVDVMAVRRDFLAAQPERAAGVVDGWYRALDYLARAPGPAAEKMLPRQGGDIAGLLDALKTLRFPARAESDALVFGPRPKLRETAARLQKLMLERGLLQRPVDLDRLFGPRPWPEPGT